MKKQLSEIPEYPKMIEDVLGHLRKQRQLFLNAKEAAGHLPSGALKGFYEQLCNMEFAFDYAAGQVEHFFHQKQFDEMFGIKKGRKK